MRGLEEAAAIYALICHYRLILSFLRRRESPICRARVNTRFNLTNDFAYAKRTVPNPAPHGVQQQEKQIMKQLVLFIAVAALVGCSGDKSPVTAGIDSAESGQSVTDSTETKATKTDKSSSSKAKENQLDESGDESESETKSSSSSKSKSSSSKAKSSSSREPEADTGASEPDTAASELEGNTSFHKTDHVEYCLQQVAEEYPRYWERTLEGTEKTLKQRCLDKLAE